LNLVPHAWKLVSGVEIVGSDGYVMQSTAWVEFVEEGTAAVVDSVVVGCTG